MPKLTAEELKNYTKEDMIALVMQMQEALAISRAKQFGRKSETMECLGQVPLAISKPECYTRNINLNGEVVLMPRTKGSKNKKSLTVDYAALIAEKQAEKDAAANEIAAVAANIEELKAELKSKKTAAKKLDKELAKLVAKKAAVVVLRLLEAAKRGEAEAMLKKLLAEGMSADEIIDKLNNQQQTVHELHGCFKRQPYRL